MPHLTEVMSVEGQRCFRPELEQMKFSCEDLLALGHRGEVEAKLHLIAVHWTDMVALDTNIQALHVNSAFATLRICTSAAHMNYTRL